MTAKQPIPPAYLVVFLVLSSACGRAAFGISSRSDAAANTQDGSSAIAVAQPPIAGQCPDGLSPCGKGDALVCYDLRQSANHCGACGHACAPGIACQAGACQQYRCKGGLGFEPVSYTVTIGEGPADNLWPVLGDFDGDGNVDLVGVPDVDAPISLLYGAGNGTFSPGPVVDSTPFRDWTGLAGDVDGDGLLDLVGLGKDSVGVMCLGDCALTVRRGTGNRSAPFGETVTFPIEGTYTDMLLADFDLDGRLDLVAVAGKALDYWRGLAGGRFEPQATLDAPDGVLAETPWPGLVATDWNGDGVLDIVYGGGMGLRFHLGRGDGSFDAEVACALAMGMVGDLDNDHRPEVISGPNLLLGIEGCHASKIVPLSDWPMLGGLALADLNGDGNLDVVADYDKNITVRVGNGQGGFAQSLSLPATNPGPWPVGVFRFGDLNRDGKLDFVFARTEGWGVFLNTCQ
jgi:hypothetical protein